MYLVEASFYSTVESRDYAPPSISMKPYRGAYTWDAALSLVISLHFYSKVAKSLNCLLKWLLKCPDRDSNILYYEFVVCFFKDRIVVGHVP